MRQQKFWRHGLGVALMGGALALVAPPVLAVSLLRPGPQDDCTIGTVTRERYREIAAAVETLPPIPWDRVVAAGTSGPNLALTEYFRGVLRPSADLDTKLATIHALLRRSGAEFTSVLASPNAPLPKSSNGLRSLSFDYDIDTWDIGLWRPVCRSSKIVVHLSARSDESQFLGLEVDQFALVVPSCFKRFSLYEPPANSCILRPEDAIKFLSNHNVARMIE
jgi:hypothetical protein